MVRAFVQVAMGHCGPIELFFVTASAPQLVYEKAVVCYICGMVHIREPSQLLVTHTHVCVCVCVCVCLCMCKYA